MINHANSHEDWRKCLEFYNFIIIYRFKRITFLEICPWLDPEWNIEKLISEKHITLSIIFAPLVQRLCAICVTKGFQAIRKVKWEPLSLRGLWCGRIQTNKNLCTYIDDGHCWLGPFMIAVTKWMYNFLSIPKHNFEFFFKSHHYNCSKLYANW